MVAIAAEGNGSETVLVEGCDDWHGGSRGISAAATRRRDAGGFHQPSPAAVNGAATATATGAGGGRLVGP